MPIKKLALAGQKFGRLTVIKEAGRDKKSNVLWLCKCDCGGFKKVSGYSLKKGTTQSCGCLWREKIKEANTVHGLKNHSLYTVWVDMKARCYYKKSDHYKYYGARGIIVCNEWKNDFKRFYDWAISHGWRKGLQINRIENDEGYEPNNCDFVTNQENVFNQRLIKSSNTTGYCGVVEKKKRCNKFVARVGYNNHLYHVGYFSTAKKAAVARDNFIVDNGWPHKLNFPEIRK